MKWLKSNFSWLIKIMTSNSGIIGFFIFWGSILTKLFYQPVLKMWDER